MKHVAHSKKTSRRFFVLQYKKLLLIGACVIILSFVIPLILNYFVFKPAKQVSYGATFSKEVSVGYGLDWRANYTALLDDLKIRRVRLMSYWNVHEPVRGQFNFDDLDWLFNEADKRGAKVSLAIGLRQPRWPECHQPGWARSLAGNQWKQALYAYIEVVTKRYRNHPALQSWQLENEASVEWFGDCETVDRTRLFEEFALVKHLDPHHPVIMTIDQHSFPVGVPAPDKFGFSVYRIVYNTFGPNFYTYFPVPLWYHRLRAMIITMTTHRPMIVHELQVEPWGPQETKNLSIAEQNRSMSVDRVHTNFWFARTIGVNEIDTWGSEWWYWRKTKWHDNSIWEAVRQELQKTKF